ncbi:hypothetical protein M5K25_023330 [Dendrobium thyrsiflorum]|uniref:Uncharacterized protein n=1 Tax=Dendrobium thyrsiflorum TaxID=117978 RepID=A0ABD0U8I1_DENTH
MFEERKGGRIIKDSRRGRRGPAGSVRKIRKKGLIVAEVCKDAVPESASKVRAVMPVTVVEVNNIVHARVPSREGQPAFASAHVISEIVIVEQLCHLHVPIMRGDDERRRSIAVGFGGG